MVTGQGGREHFLAVKAENTAVAESVVAVMWCLIHCRYILF